jgi:hypothetical protein
MNWPSHEQNAVDFAKVGLASGQALSQVNEQLAFVVDSFVSAYVLANS